MDTPVQVLDSAFFQGLAVTPQEGPFVDGCREVAAGNNTAALVSFRNATHLADGAFMAGFLALGEHLFEDAEAFLKSAIQDGPNLGLMFSKYGLVPRMELSITHEVLAHLSPCVKSATLALVEIYQRQQRWHDASRALQYLYRLDPSDLVVRLSIAEIFIETKSSDPQACRKVVQLAEGIGNHSEVHAALLLCKAMALRGLNMPTAALEVLSSTLRRTKGRSEGLLRALRYQRALVFDEQGQCERARAELEKLYAEAPDFEDVAERLGVK